MDKLHGHWTSTWADCALAPPAGLLERLLAAWREPQRHYHTLQHLEECLALFDEVRDQAHHPADIELALWFHDAVYDVHAHGNEERSARWADEALYAAGLAPDSVRRIHGLIMATCHGAAPACANPDAALLTDIDLAILGAPEARFAEYERQIRAEYAWVAPEIYAVKRRAVLRGFLERAAIYATPVLHRRLERQARRNLERVINNATDMSSRH
jgi:predicted metal-dependent HD superfamily phosphohydrolase